MASEFDFIDWVRAQRPAGGAWGRVLVPPGDDLAVMRWDAGDDGLLVVGADQVLDGVHFDASVHAPRLIGRKVMNRNLSDCAAMACLPAAAVATVALPRGAGADYARELYAGLREAADPFACPIVGGDTGSWDGRLALTVTIFGRSAGVTPVRRGGARAGEGVYVTGPLGGSILGRHLTFEPRVGLSRRLAAGGDVTAMIDLSDGLSRDLGHVCRASGVGAVIDAVAVPVHGDAVELSRRDGRPPLDHALHDGEDYELLFTGRPREYPDATRVGVVTDEPGATWLRLADGSRRPLAPEGWEHTL
jgi:thiamine-monophosphate kinase